jgi:16S rRNA (cytidine1402-2'-O)-methyltransferase
VTRRRGTRRSGASRHGHEAAARPAGTREAPRDPAPTGARGTLFVVGTPIGNLDDLSARAIETLRSCRLIACEDTRVTRAILDRHGIGTRLMSSHKFNETAVVPRLLEVLEAGGDVAIVSDSGTPGLSDPGAVAVREARRAGVRVVPIPGPSAAAALWSVSGFSGPFTVVGFLPHRRGERRRALEAVAGEPGALVLFESPHRVLDLLEDAAGVLGDRDCCIGREMTKMHEEFLAGTLADVRRRLAARPVRGEFALAIAGAGRAGRASRPEATAADLEAAATLAARMIGEGMARPEAVRRAARSTGVPRRELYRRMLVDRAERAEAGEDAEE